MEKKDDLISDEGQKAIKRVIRKGPAGQNGDNQMREVFQPADNIIAPNLQDFPWAPTCQLAIHPTSEKSKLPHHGFTCSNWLAPNSTLVTFIRIFLSKVEELARQGGTSATLNSIQGSVGIGWHWYLHWLALVSSLVGIGWHWYLQSISQTSWKVGIS